MEYWELPTCPFCGATLDDQGKHWAGELEECHKTPEFIQEHEAEVFMMKLDKTGE